MFKSVHHLSRKSFQCNTVSVAFIFGSVSREQSCLAPHRSLVDVGHLVVFYMSLLERKVVHKSSFGNKLSF